MMMTKETPLEQVGGELYVSVLPTYISCLVWSVEIG